MGLRVPGALPPYIQPLRVSLMGSPPTDQPASATVPTVSVVIPTFSRPESLARCLAALEAQTLPRRAFEVIVCDDGSPSPAASTVKPFADRMTVRVVRRPSAGPAAARNEAARHARAAILAFTDDDCVPSPLWL